MNAGAAGKLYTPQLLALATELAQFPLGTDQWQWDAQSRSRTCGSTITLGMDTSAGGDITRFGLCVSACAVGQASAAIMARALPGKTGSDILAARDALQRWIDTGETLPDWPGLAILQPAREHPARHGAILLPWNAAAKALSLRTQPS